MVIEGAKACGILSSNRVPASSDEENECEYDMHAEFLSSQ